MKHLLTLLATIAFAFYATAQPLPSETAREKKIQRLNQVTRARPKDVGAWHDLADLYREAGRWDEAIAAETRAIAGHPKYAAAHYGRGRALMAKRDYSKARADFSRAIDLWESRGGLEVFLTLEQAGREHVDAYKSRGLGWAADGRYQEGLADLGTAIRLKRHDPDLHMTRAEIREKAGLLSDAVADYRLAGLLCVDGGHELAARAAVLALKRLKADRESEEIRNRIEHGAPHEP
jgi:tetratricopeptide (TPR) repeat protein